jgi:hypothetical protein
MSQGEVAKMLGWSLSKMQRIESGDVGVSPTDLRALLNIYGVTDPDGVERLMNNARVSRRQRYLTTPEHREHLTPGLLQLMQFEQQAVSIRVYQPSYYPGVLQTPTVAEEILSFWRHRFTDEGRRVRYDVRMSRRKQVIESGEGPEYCLILDESVIKRTIRDAEVTAEQLEDIADLSLRPKVHIRIVPLTMGAYMPSLGAFQVLSLSDEADNAVLYREGFLQDAIVHDPKEVDFHLDAFQNLWDQAFNEDATRRAVLAEAARQRSLLDYEH